MKPNMNQMNSMTFAEVGIKRDIIVPYNPEHNDFVEKEESYNHGSHMCHDL